MNNDNRWTDWCIECMDRVKCTGAARMHCSAKAEGVRIPNEIAEEIDRLRAELAKPEAKPVAYIHHTDEGYKELTFMTPYNNESQMQPLYTAPVELDTLQLLDKIRELNDELLGNIKKREAMG